MTTHVKRSYLEDALAEADVDPERARWDYSGRGMYGRTCFGFVGNFGDLARFCYELGHEVGELSGSDDPSSWDEANELSNVNAAFLGSVRVDDMGLDLIFYFPDVEVVDNTSSSDKPTT